MNIQMDMYVYGYNKFDYRNSIESISHLHTITENYKIVCIENYKIVAALVTKAFKVHLENNLYYYTLYHTKFYWLLGFMSVMP